jgi:hypothetical protein
MENLQIGRLQVIIDRLEILKKNIASLYELLKGSGDLQVGKLQTIADKLEALIERLVQGNQSINQKLVWLFNQSKSIDKVYELLRGNGESTNWKTPSNRAEVG